MKTEVAQLFKAIGTIIKEDLETLERHIKEQEYIKGALRDSEIEESVIRAKLKLFENVIKFIELEDAQNEPLTEMETQILGECKKLLSDLKIDHKMEDRY